MSLMKPLLGGLFMMLILLATFGTSVYYSSAQTPTVQKFSLPSGSNSVGLVFHNGWLYYASYDYGFVMQVNASTGAWSNVTTDNHQTYANAFDRMYYGLTADNTGNLWLTRRNQGNDGTPAGISKINIATGLETFVVSNDAGEWDGIGYSNGFVYAAAGDTFYQINASTSQIFTYTIPGPGYTGYFGFAPDQQGNIWFSDIINGLVCEFVPSTTLITCHGGFNRPLGIAFLGNTAYVAENVRSSDSGLSPAIASFSVSSPAVVSRTDVVGSPYDIANVAGTIIWSSSAEDFAATTTVCTIGGVCTNTGEVNYYIVSNGPIAYVSYFGSSGVAKVSSMACWHPSTVTVKLANGHIVNAALSSKGCLTSTYILPNSLKSSAIVSVTSPFVSSWSKAIGSKFHVSFV